MFINVCFDPLFQKLFKETSKNRGNADGPIVLRAIIRCLLRDGNYIRHTPSRRDLSSHETQVEDILEWASNDMGNILYEKQR